jgi:transcriptional regulator with XRE-family HTH domain
VDPALIANPSPVDRRPRALPFNGAMSHPIGQLDRETRDALQILGAVLRELRGSRGLSQRSLASRCGLSQSTISRLENGLAEGVRVAWIARILAALDTVVRLRPDDRPLIERSHAYKHLWQAFSPSAGAARLRARELERRERLEAYAASRRAPGEAITR